MHVCKVYKDDILIEQFTLEEEDIHFAEFEASEKLRERYSAVEQKEIRYEVL